LKLQKTITEIFIFVCTLICLFFIIPVLCFIPILFAVPSHHVYLALLLLLIVWGISLFVRYVRLYYRLLNTSKRRLWIETILMNVLWICSEAAYVYWGLSGVDLFAFVISDFLKKMKLVYNSLSSSAFGNHIVLFRVFSPNY